MRSKGISNFEMNAKRKTACRGCIMAEEQAQMHTFEKMGIVKIGKYKNGSYIVEIPTERIEEFVNFYTKIMKPGYWNEYLGPKTGFFGKSISEKIWHYPLTEQNKNKINKTMHTYVSGWKSSTDLWKWLADVEIYGDWIKE